MWLGAWSGGFWSTWYPSFALSCFSMKSSFACTIPSFYIDMISALMILLFLNTVATLHLHHGPLYKDANISHDQLQASCKWSWTESLRSPHPVNFRWFVHSCLSSAASYSAYDKVSPGNFSPCWIFSEACKIRSSARTSSRAPPFGTFCKVRRLPASHSCAEGGRGITGALQLNEFHENRLLFKRVQSLIC